MLSEGGMRPTRLPLLDHAVNGRPIVQLGYCFTLAVMYLQLV